MSLPKNTSQFLASAKSTISITARGLNDYATTKNNADGMEKLTDSIRQRPNGLIFCNLVDFDMLYGHRKDVEGFAQSLEEFDAWLAKFLPTLKQSDLLLHHRRPRLRPRPTLAHHRSFSRIRPHPCLHTSKIKRGTIKHTRNARGHGPNHRRKFRRRHSPRKKFFKQF